MRRSAAAILWLTCLGAAVAQTPTASVTGTVEDESHGVVRQALVTARNQGTGAQRSAYTDDKGRYFLLQLAPGPYRISAAAPGFRTAIRSAVALSIGTEALVDFTLEVGPVTTETVVTAEAPAVNTRAAGLSSVMENHSIRELPLNGRDFAQLALLEPGVAPSRRSSDSGGPGTKLVIGGNRPSQVSFLLDGSDINDANNNTPGSVAGVLLGVDTLYEFRVATNAYDASYGRSAGGVVSAATRSGTNQFHGSLFSFHRNSALDARNFFDPHGEPIPAFKRNQFGVVAEGPVRRDRTFFLASYEGLRQRLGVTNRSVVPDAAARGGVLPGRAPVAVSPAVMPYLDLVPLPNDRDFGDGSGEYVAASRQSTGENFVTARLDHRFSDSQSVFGRYTYDAAAVRVPDGFNLVRADTTSRNQYSTTRFLQVVNPSLLNETRFSFNRSASASGNTFLRDVDPSLSFLPGVPLGNIFVTGMFSLGPGRFGPAGSGLSLFHWSDDIAVTRGRHSLKAGVDHRWIRFETVRPQSPWGYYQFSSLTDFLLARPRAVELTLPGSELERNWRQSMTAAFVQDEIAVTRRLTLHLGLRYERVSVPRETRGLEANLRDPLRDAETTRGAPLFVNPSNRNFAPRAGLAWDPRGTGKTSVRAAFGLFFDPLWTDFYGNAGSRQPPFYVLGSIRNPVFPNAASLIGSPDFVPGRLDALEHRPHSPYTMQYNVSVQREVWRQVVVTLSYAGQRGVHLPRLVDANQALPVILPDGRKFFPEGSVERNPHFTGIRYKVTDVNSFYNAFQAAVERRFGSLRWKASYAYSKNIDDGSITMTQGGDNDMTQDPDSRKSERGLSNYDLRHYLVVYFSQSLPAVWGPKWLAGGWEWNGIATAASGNPFTVAVGYDRARARFQAGGATPQRPDLVPGRSNNPVLGGPDRYFDAAAFALPQAGFYGNLGRNTLIGPGLFTVDASLTRRFRLGDGVTLQFRSEVFNSLNHANLAIPSQRTVFSSSGAVGSAGRITATATSARQVQFGLKMIF